MHENAFILPSPLIDMGIEFQLNVIFPGNCESHRLLAFRVTIESPKHSDYQPFV